MIGNDLVCFKSNPTRVAERHERYLRKTFTAKEREVIVASRFPFINLLLWSAKEAAFKIYMQQHPEKEKFYAPKKFEVSIKIIKPMEASGTVTYLSKIYFFSTNILDDYLHTIAVANEATLPSVFTNIYKKVHNQERRIMNPEFGKIEILKNQFGIPKAFVKGEELPYAVSVSHDGEWEAVVILNENFKLK